LEDDGADLQLDQVVTVVDLTEVLDQHPRGLGTVVFKPGSTDRPGS
jgi:hypothetical protein